MNCQRFEDVVGDIAREQIIDAGERVEALGHGERCERCAQRLADERAMTIHLRSLAKEMKSAGAPERVEARLLAAFDEFALTQFPAPSVSAPPHPLHYFVGADAALVLNFFGLVPIPLFAPA